MLFSGGGHTRTYASNINLLVVLQLICFVVPFSSVVPGPRGQAFVRRTSSVCRIDSECPTNAYCEHSNPPTGFGICACLQGHFILTHNFTRECIRFATAIGDYCQYDDQCQYVLSTDSECRANSCQCQEGTHYVERERRCYKTSYLGQYCRLTNNCFGDDTYCRDGVCVCAVGKHPNAARNLCLPDVYLGEKCYRDEECITEHSECNDVCRCRVSHILSRKQNQCLPIAGKLYDLCEEDLQCLYQIPFSRCLLAAAPSGEIVGNCTCANGYHQIGYKCYATVFLNGICEANENCALDLDTSCVEGRCRCVDHMLEVDGKCSLGSRSQMSLYAPIFVVLLSLKTIVFSRYFI